jgi:hypothetical protein
MDLSDRTPNSQTGKTTYPSEYHKRMGTHTFDDAKADLSGNERMTPDDAVTLKAAYHKLPRRGGRDHTNLHRATYSGRRTGGDTPITRGMDLPDSTLNSHIGKTTHPNEYHNER